MSRLAAIAFFCALSLAAGCSSADSGTTSTPVTDSDAAPDTHLAEVAAPDTATAPEDTAPPVCWFIKSGRAEERKCDDCSDVKCKTERETCFGPAYITGTFGGVCKDYITCQCGCSEGDDTCQQACKIEATRDCDSCVAKIADCENTQCASVCAPTL